MRRCPYFQVKTKPRLTIVETNCKHTFEEWDISDVRGASHFCVRLNGIRDGFTQLQKEYKELAENKEVEKLHKKILELERENKSLKYKLDKIRGALE